MLYALIKLMNARESFAPAYVPALVIGGKEFCNRGKVLQQLFATVLQQLFALPNHFVRFSHERRKNSCCVLPHLLQPHARYACPLPCPATQMHPHDTTSLPRRDYGNPKHQRKPTANRCRQPSRVPQRTVEALRCEHRACKKAAPVDRMLRAPLG